MEEKRLVAFFYLSTKQQSIFKAQSEFYSLQSHEVGGYVLYYFSVKNIIG